MKKLLLAAILLLSVTSFATERHDDGCKDKADATIDVKASICYPLLADGIRPLRFGGIEAGTGKVVPVNSPNTGLLMVQGQVGRDVEIKYDPTIWIYNQSPIGPAEFNRILVTPALVFEDGPGTVLSPTGETFVLNDVNIFPFQRREYLRVAGRIVPAQTAGKAPGDYLGTFTAYFKYD